MNNIELIKKDYKLGDLIRISCSLGIKEGKIVEFLESENRIKIQPYDSSQKPFYLLDSSIIDWEEGKKETVNKTVYVKQNNNNNIKQKQTASKHQKEKQNNTSQENNKEPKEDFYKKAKDCYNNKDYDNAIKNFYEAIKNDQKKISAIKDLGMLFLSLAKNSESLTDKNKYIKDAKKLMDKYAASLPICNKTDSYLENFYYTTGELNKWKNIAEKILKTLDKSADGPRYVFLLIKLAAYKISKFDIEEAKTLLNEALNIYPASDKAKELLNLIDSNDMINISDIESKIRNIVDVENTEVLTPFTKYTLDNYIDYFGVKEKERGNFTSDTLKSVRNLIAERQFAGMPTERARYLLTEGKLIQQLEPEKTYDLRSAMSRYCNDMAKIHIFNNEHPDIIRFYYMEAFTLQTSYNATSKLLSYYLLSLNFKENELSDLMKRNVTVTVQHSLSEVMRNCNSDKWDSILNVILYNSGICGHIVSMLYDSYLEASLDALKNFGIEISEKESIEKDEYIEAWNKARTNRVDEYNFIRNSIISLASSADRSNIKDILNELSSLSKYKKSWLGEIDNERIDKISNKIVPVLISFYDVEKFKDKQWKYNEAIELLNPMIEGIIEHPTKLSFEAILTLLKTILNITKETFNDILIASKPEPKISLLRSETVVNQNDVLLQIEISIKEDTSSIYNVSIEIIDNDDVKDSIDSEAGNQYKYNGLIEAGGTYVFKPIVKVSDSVLENKSASFCVKCCYTYMQEQNEFETNLSLHLYNPEEFQPIDNPYASVAEGGPLEHNSDMFYGQKDTIQNVVNAIINNPSKQVIIYGQKRSGKSSVLNMVKHELTEKGVFCVDFSMGKIVNNISEFSFYYKILSVIKEKLETLAESGETVPGFKIPSRNEFANEDRDNPLETFCKYIKYFKNACKNTQGWENCRLVVLIDEFTYLYGAIQSNKVSKHIMDNWKSICEDKETQFSAVLVGQDVIPAFKNEPYARNAFGIIQDIRLSYLKEDDAEELIQKPIYNNGNSRYADKAVKLIMDYTACNPYYIQIFCSNLVNFMNKKHYINVTESDVMDVAKELTSGSNALDSSKFENLLTSGETDSIINNSNVVNDDAKKLDNIIKKHPDKEVEIVLKSIAKASENGQWAKRTDIDTTLNNMKTALNARNTTLTEDDVTDILQQLITRDVLAEKDNMNFYKIKVRLYKEWLLNH